MKVSIQSIKALNARYGCVGDIAPDGAEALAVTIGSQLGAIEETHYPGAMYAGVLIATVVSCVQHPDADRLRVCKLDDGGKAEGVERDADGYVQVVCGAPNVREGLLVAWLPPGVTVPESYGKDPFVLEARALRGVVSNGMLASPRELGLGDSHEGILEIDGDIAPGTDFAGQYGLAGDVIFDIENKMFTHRPDCFGLLGVSRELAGIQQLAFTSPDWYRCDATPPTPEAAVLPLAVRNELPALVPRFTMIAMSGITVKTSPVWLQVELTKAGLRPINNIVDLTNFIMLETGQPLHAYDYDKVKALNGSDGDSGVTIEIRHPKPGENIKLLNGKELEPRPEAVMIASGQHLLGVGGAMGGANTEVDDNTRNIIIEVGNFDMYSIRRTSMAHGLFTDAVTRFTKGQSPLANRAVLTRMVEDVRTLAGGKVAGELIDVNNLPPDVVERKALHAPVNVTAEFINARLGLTLTTEDIAQLLTNVECSVEITSDGMTVTAPFWRTDIEIPEDIVEEVGRLYGFDRLPLQLPLRPARPVAANRLVALKQAARDSLAKAGANEVLAYSFVHGKLLEKAGQEPAVAFKLSNALSPDLQYYRLSLLPSLLDKVHPNVKAGYGEFALFELGKGHNIEQVDGQTGLPVETESLDVVYAASDKHKRSGAAFYRVRRLLEALASDLGLALEYTPAREDTGSQSARPYDPARSAIVSIKGGQSLGIVGELRPAVLRGFKLPGQTAAFSLELQPLLTATAEATIGYRALSRYPKVEQDVSLKIANDIAYGQLYQLLEAALQAAKPAQSHLSLSPLDIYQRSDDPEHKQVTLRVSITSYAKTMRDVEVSGLLDKAVNEVGRQLEVQRL